MKKICLLAPLLLVSCLTYSQQWLGSTTAYGTIYRADKIKVGYGPLYLDWTYQQNWGGNANLWAGYVGFNAYRNSNDAKDYYYGENAYTSKSVFEGSNAGFRWLYRAPVNNDSGGQHLLSELMVLDASGRLGIGTTSPATPLHIYSNSSNFGVWSNIQIPMVVISPGSTEAMRGTASRYAGSSFGVIGEAGTGVGDAAGIYGKTLSGSGGVSVAGYFNGDLTYTGSFGKASDIKFKENITDLSAGLSVIKKLKPKEYTYKKTEGYNFPTEMEVGLIAQEVQEILPSIVKLASNLMAKDQSDKPDRYLSVDYLAIVPFLIKAIQEQQVVIDKHQSILNSMFAVDESDSMQARVSNQFSVPYIKSISPNPAQTQVTIELAIPVQSKSVNLVLLDKNGKSILNVVVDSNKYTDKIVISTIDLNQDIYILSLVVEGVSMDIKRIIVTK